MSYTRSEFIKLLAPAAVATMKTTDLSAALTIAQGCLESRDGNSGLTKKGNNLYGIKGRGDAGSVVMRTREQKPNGEEYFYDASFAKFSSWAACTEARSRLLLKGVSWNPNIYKDVPGKRGREAARAIQAAGYATDKKYADLLIGIMDAHNLYQYDEIPEPTEKGPEVFEAKFQINRGEVVDAFNIDGKIYVPNRDLAKVYGVKPGWDNEKKQAFFNGKKIDSFYLDEGRVYVQLAPIAKAYGGDFGFDNKSKKAFLIKGAK